MHPVLIQLKNILEYGSKELASKQELEVFLKAVIQVIGDLQKGNEKNATTLLSHFQAIHNELGTKHKTIEATQKDVLKLVAEAKRIVAIVPDMPTIVSGLEEKIASIPPPKDFVHDTALIIRDKLETLKGKERLDRTAVAGIYELEKKLEDKIDALPRGRLGGGGITDVGVQSSLGRIVKTETPSGAINNVNTTYTVSQPIYAVLSFSINGQVISDREYTISNRTITMARALDNSLAGTNFRITYV